MNLSQPIKILIALFLLTVILTFDQLIVESNDVIELIKKLGELHSAGILTDAEFNTKKSELLSKI